MALLYVGRRSLTCKTLGTLLCEAAARLVDKEPSELVWVGPLTPDGQALRRSIAGQKLAETLLNRAWGHPTTPVEAEVKGEGLAAVLKPEDIQRLEEMLRQLRSTGRATPITARLPPTLARRTAKSGA